MSQPYCSEVGPSWKMYNHHSEGNGESKAWVSQYTPTWCRYLGGYISALFFAVGAPSALLVGYLCDHMDRRNLLFIVVILGAPLSGLSDVVKTVCCHNRFWCQSF